MFWYALSEYKGLTRYHTIAMGQQDNLSDGHISWLKDVIIGNGEIVQQIGYLAANPEKTQVMMVGNQAMGKQVTGCFFH